MRKTVMCGCFGYGLSVVETRPPTARAGEQQAPPGRGADGPEGAGIDADVLEFDLEEATAAADAAAEQEAVPQLEVDDGVGAEFDAAVSDLHVEPGEDSGVGLFAAVPHADSVDAPSPLLEAVEAGAPEPPAKKVSMAEAGLTYVAAAGGRAWAQLPPVAVPSLPTVKVEWPAKEKAAEIVEAEVVDEVVSDREADEAAPEPEPVAPAVVADEADWGLGLW